MEIASLSSVPGAKKVLIVSTYKTRCGMASHTEVLLSHLRGNFSIDVFPLDQFVLRNDSKRCIAAGDAAIQRLCTKLGDYDVVVLQWEPGFWGLRHNQILKRVRMFCKHVRRLVLVKHTVLEEPAELSFSAVTSVLSESGFRRSVAYLRRAVTNLNSKLYNLFKEIDRRGELTVIAHTQKDRRFLEAVVGFRDVRDHPLCHVHEEWFDRLISDGAAARKELERNYGPSSVFVATFGFLAEHKSYDTIIAALRFLPENFKLLIYGGVHHYNMRNNERINPYVKKLNELIRGDINSVPQSSFVATKKSQRTVPENDLQSLLGPTMPIEDRVIFMGAPDDYDFAVAIAACDIAVLPYLEVGQSASGPASQIVEIGAKLVSTNAQPFVELNRYFPGRIEMFDIGNYAQLSVAIRRALIKPTHAPFSTELNSRTQREFYINAIEDTASKDHGGARGEAA